jgi:tetratricopeptide (TPR) repeat protein
MAVCYDAAMRRLTLAVLCAVAAAAPLRAADDPLARARALYNQKQFEEAISAAEQARLQPARADAADLVAARAYLERFRASAASDDLTNARDRLRRIDPQRFAPRERLEYVVGLGETLFFDGAPGAAAEVFDSALQSRELIAGDARDRVLDWWASALDREARPRSDIERQPIYLRIRARMEDELATHPGSATAPYWLAAAARAQGDTQAAWNAAQAAWVRAPLTPDKGAALREDLDRLVLRAIVPDRAKATAQPPDSLRAQWEMFKERWATGIKN